MAKKKCYNPFKMWGSWTGFGIGTFMLMLGILKCLGMCPGYITMFSKIWMGMPIIVYPVGGFMLGWGIHSLIRKLM